MKFDWRGSAEDYRYDRFRVRWYRAEGKQAAGFSLFEHECFVFSSESFAAIEKFVERKLATQ